MTEILIVLAVALLFEFINGFHDTANAIATVVSTKVMTPRQAIIMASLTNLLGALWGTAVAKTIASGLVQSEYVTSQTILCALLGAIVWNLITWWWGLPSSSSHALVGGLCGAALAASNNNFDAIIWSVPSGGHLLENKGVLWKVILPMLASPVIGFFLGFCVMGVLFVLCSRAKHHTANFIFNKLQIGSAASMGFMHGTNDAQKTMGIMALTLLAASQQGVFETAPSWLGFLTLLPDAAGQLEIPLWIKMTCAIVMAAGTAAGGWKIIKTLGNKLVILKPVHGFAAETSSSLILLVCSSFGIPVSTTHVISSSILGVGASRSLTSIKWSVAERMIWAWIFTLPMAGGMAYLFEYLIKNTSF